VLGRRRTAAVKENAAAAADLARQLAADKKFRKQLVRASGHAARANRRIRSRFGLLAAFRQVAMDRQLRTELAQLVEELQAIWKRAEKKGSHRVRNFLLVVGGAGAATAVALPRVRRWLGSRTERRRGPEAQETIEAQQAA
jgi:hypothetical protein